MDPKSEFGVTLIQLHFTLGFSLFVFIVLRIIWRIMNVQPDDPDVSPLEKRAGRGMHYILYLIMFLMPLTGLLAFGPGIKFFGMFEIPPMYANEVGQWFKPNGGGAKVGEYMRDFHRIVGEWVLWVLVVIHMLAGFYHHFGLKNDVLKRMLPWGR